MTIDEHLRKAPVGVLETTTDGRITDADETAATMLERSSETLVGSDIEETFPQSAPGTLRAVFEGGSPTAASFEEYYPRLDRWFAVDVTVDDAVYVYVRDQTQRQEAEQAVDQLEDRLTRVQQINTLVATVLQRVIGATGRVDVGETVCERLGGTDLYRFAWVGEHDFSADRLRTLAAAGEAAELHDQIADALGHDQALPEQDAVATGETTLVQAIAGDESIPRGVRRAAFGNGLQSCLAVPLAYQGTVYGVVSVYSGQEDGFSEQERVGLETLGSVAGFAIRSIRQENMLVSDTVTEVTLEVTDETVPFVRAASDVDGPLTLDGLVPRGDGAVVCYLGMDEPNPELDGNLSAADGVADVRWIRSEEDPLVQVTLDSETPVTALTAWGATVRTATYTAETARLAVTVPSEGDVRRLVETVDETVAETTLLSTEQTARDPDTVDAFRDDISALLTERQETVLRTAYLSEYFASPRGSSSEEVAETLDIAGSTLLYHLRRAQRKLLDAYFATEITPVSDS